MAGMIHGNYFRVFRSEWYDKKLKKLTPSEQQIVSTFEQRLKLDPFSGKPLGYPFFREKKFDGKRILFLVYAEHLAVFLVTITDKKMQQQVINIIRSQLTEYRETIERLMKQT